MEEKLRQKVDDIIIILNKDDEMQFEAKALIAEKYVSGNPRDSINAVVIIQQKDYKEFSYMHKDEFFEKVKEIYKRVQKTEMQLEEIGEKIKEELKKENEELEFAYEE